MCILAELWVLLRSNVAKRLVKDYGGTVTTTVDRHTAMVLAGLRSIPKKLVDAKKLDVPVVDEDGFYALIKGMSDTGETTELEDSGVRAARSRQALAGLSLAD